MLLVQAWPAAAALRGVWRRLSHVPLCPTTDAWWLAWRALAAAHAVDELIREVTINCAERGLLLLRVRDEMRMTIAAYQTLYESAVAFGMRKALQTEQVGQAHQTPCTAAVVALCWWTDLKDPVELVGWSVELSAASACGPAAHARYAADFARHWVMSASLVWPCVVGQERDGGTHPAA